MKEKAAQCNTYGNEEGGRDHDYDREINRKRERKRRAAKACQIRSVLGDVECITELLDRRFGGEPM